MKYWVVVVQWMVLATAWAATNTPGPKALLPGNRFLFVVETSASISRLEHGGRQAVFDLLYTGVEGRMRTGDTYGIWTFNEAVFAGMYPMQTWNSKAALQHASQAGRFLKAQKYEKEGNLDPVMKQLAAVLRVAKDVNVIIVTDGTRPVQGTPFDEAINASFAANAVQVRETKKPLVTVLAARNGQFTGAQVAMAGEPITLADLPKPVIAEPTNAVPAIVASAQTNAAPTATITANSKPPGQVLAIKVLDDEDDVKPPPVLNTNATVAEMRREESQPVAVPEVKTNLASIPAPTQSNPATAETNPAPAAVVDSSPAPPPVATTPTPEATQPPVPHSLPKVIPGEIRAEAQEVRPATTPARAAGLTQSASTFASVMLILGGALVGAGAVLAVVWMWKLRGDPQPSFISRGMDRN